jgi:hypothetical protein
MASTIKVNNIQNQCGANIVNKCSTTITLGASGDNITLAAGATQSGFGRTGTVDWDTTAKTAGFTAVSGNGYFVNTTSGAITVTLPATPSAGDIVAISDYARTFATNNVTVGRNGSLIQGTATDGTISTNGQSTTFVYVDGTKGWVPTEDQTTGQYGALFITATGGTVTCCGDYKIHTFTSPGTFTVTCAGNASGSNTVDYLVVAGGGGGGSKGATVGEGGAGGAGGGGYRSNYPSGCAGIPVSATGYPITVGGGGSAGPVGTPFTTGTNGSNSVFSTITSAGGGAGANAGNSGPANAKAGNSGGAGGGGGASCTGGAGGAGNTPPVSPPQGQNGGNGAPGGYGGGSGGGASVAGSNAPASPGGVGGGNGTANLINPATGEPSGGTQYYAGGGGGGNWCSPAIPAGGLGGGGNGAGQPSPTVVPAESGTANTGGGGGGGFASPGSGGTGGSGIVIIRYKYQ